jgi:CRP-like cAMP-binding protein
MSEDNDKNVQLIRQLNPICELPANSQSEIISSGKLLNVKKKGTLFKQGDRDNFSFYLLDGEIDLFANDQQQNSITAGSDRALYAMVQLQPRQFSAKAKTDSVVFQIQRDVLDRLMVHQGNDDPISDSSFESTSSNVEVSELDEDEALKKKMQESREKVLAETNKQLEEAEALRKEMEVMREEQGREASEKMQEALRLKEEVEASRVAMEAAAEEKRKEQDAMEQQIQEAAKVKLEEERRKLSEEFARNNEELEMAKREKAEAEAARQGAKDEAEKIIAEYKMTQDQSLAEQKAELKAERLKLEEEQKIIKETLLEVKQAKEEAQEAKKQAMAEVEALRGKLQDEQAVADKTQQDSISVEIKQAEEKISKAAAEIVQAQQAQVKAVTVKSVVDVDLQKKRNLKQQLRDKMAEDLSQFRHERDEEEKAFDSDTILEKMRRIKESAEAAKKDAKQKDDGLLGDIAAQLGGRD